MKLQAVLAANIKRLRMEAGYSQEELAEAIGCSDTNLQRMENPPGMSHPSMALVQGIADVLCGGEAWRLFVDNLRGDK